MLQIGHLAVLHRAGDQRYALRMAGYSATPLAKKLGIREHDKVVVLNGPAGFDETLGELPEDATLLGALPRSGQVAVIVLFVRSRAELAKGYERASKRLTDAGGLWIAWPKKASGVKTDMTEDAVRELCLPSGLVDNKVCAIDDTWSGLRLVWRKELRGEKRKAR
jgi:hypothetical protein